MLAVNHALQVLVFEGNHIGDDGTSLISKGLHKNTKLTELWIQRCSLSTQGSIASHTVHIDLLDCTPQLGG